MIRRVAIEAVRKFISGEVAGEKLLGRKRDGDVAYRGRQGGPVLLGGRAVNVDQSRLRRTEDCEVAIPAYEACHQLSGLGSRILE